MSRPHGVQRRSPVVVAASGHTVHGELSGARRNGMPEHVAYHYDGDGADALTAFMDEPREPAPRQPVPAAAVPAPADDIVYVPRQALQICPPCWADLCAFCLESGCLCACQDWPAS